MLPESARSQCNMFSNTLSSCGNCATPPLSQCPSLAFILLHKSDKRGLCVFLCMCAMFRFADVGELPRVLWVNCHRADKVKTVASMNSPLHSYLAEAPSHFNEFKYPMLHCKQILSVLNVWNAAFLSLPKKYLFYISSTDNSILVDLKRFATTHYKRMPILGSWKQSGLIVLKTLGEKNKNRSTAGHWES